MSVGFDSKTNTYYAYFETRDAITKKRIMHKKRGFTSKRKATKWEIDEKNRISLVTIPFCNVANMYFNTTDCNEMSRKHYNHVINYYFKELKDIDINKITKVDLLKWSTNLKSMNLSSKTINNVLSTIRAIYKFADTYYDVKNISGVLVNKKATISEKKTFNVWDVKEFNKFLKCIDNPIYHAYFNTLYWTGIRRGEGMALLKSDVSKDGYITINKSMRNLKEGVSTPKTLSSVRKIKLSTNTFTELKTLLKRNGKYLYGDIAPLSATNIQRVFEKGIEKSGVSKIRIHDLRHSHATVLINNGVNIVAVSKRLGHSNVNMTLKVYTHLLDKSEDELMNKINKLSK